MRNKSSRKRSNEIKKASDYVIKTSIQSIVALLLFLIVWGMSVSNQPQISAMCDKIKHYLTYSYDVKSVFNQINNTQEVNDDTH